MLLGDNVPKYIQKIENILIGRAITVYIEDPKHQNPQTFNSLCKMAEYFHLPRNKFLDTLNRLCITYNT